MKRRIEKLSKFITAINQNDIFFLEKELQQDDVNISDKEGRTLLHHAVLAKNDVLVKYLVSRGVDVNAKDNEGWTAMHYAAQNFDSTCIHTLLLLGGNINAQDNYGNTVLWRAVFDSKGRPDLIVMLLANGADASIENVKGISPVKLARSIANYDLEKYFNDNGR